MSSNPLAIELKTAPGQARVPRHVGVIMDGNGRWAKARGLSRTEGHRAGVDAVRRLVEAAIEEGVSYLTIFSFSSENWTRPPEEVSFIFGLLRRFVASDLGRLIAHDVQVRVIGSREGLDMALNKTLDEVVRKTSGGTGLVLQIALNYGARAELVSAVRAIAGQAERGEIAPDAIDEATISHHLATRGVPDPDLIIRTSGEMRLSNFLLWQSAYAELVFLDTLWPDFGAADFAHALAIYSERHRRFGGIGS